MKTQNFASKLGAFLVLAGSAVGLGNIWKFPYTLGNNGGAAFLMVYLFFVFVFGIPLMIAELSIGRAGGSNSIDAFSKPYRIFGYSGVITMSLILCSYSTIGGWTLAYTSYYFLAFLGIYHFEDPAIFYENLISHPIEPLVWQAVFMFLTALLLARGIHKGLEKGAKIMMPILFFGLVALAVLSFGFPKNTEALAFMFTPNFSKIDFPVILAAMGQAFFSLSLGTAVMTTYGAYVDKKENLSFLATKVALADTAIALLAGLAIFPAVFSFGLLPTAGPGLIFLTLPKIFEQLPMGYFLGFFFFLLVLFAALTSSIAMLETSVSYFVTHKNYSRKKTTFIIATFLLCIGFVMSLSEGKGILSSYLIFDKNISTFFSDITDKLMIAFTALGCAIFAGWGMGKKFEQEMLNQDQLDRKFYHSLIFVLVRYILPVLIGIVLYKGFYLLLLEN